MYKNLGNIMVKNTKSKDNCYCVGNISEVVCNKLSLSIEELWHQHFGHVNYKILKKISSLNIIICLPSITTMPRHFCGPFQLGKQSKSQYKKNQHLSIMRPFALLYIDLMGPLHTANIDGRKYIMVVAVDFSRYIWVIFLREK